MSLKRHFGSLAVVGGVAFVVSLLTARFTMRGAPPSSSAPPLAPAAPATVYVVRERAEAPSIPNELPRTAASSKVEIPPTTDSQGDQEPEELPVADRWEARFVSDERPNQTSRSAEGLIRSAFSNQPGTRLQEVECHLAVCRAVVQFDSPEVDRKTIRDVLLAPDPQVLKDRGVVIPERVPLPAGGVAATMYFYSAAIDPTKI